MTIEEIRKYRALTTGGYEVHQLQEVSIDGIKKFRNAWNQSANLPIYGGYWDSDIPPCIPKYDNPLSAIYGRVWGIHNKS